MNRHLYSIPFLLTMLSSCSPDPLNPVAPYYQCTDYVSGACAPYLSSDPCPPAPLESCDGIDNDCNGEVDEQNGRTGLPCPKAPVFECLDYTTCERYSSSEPCPPEPSEVCDAVDNNCNGLIDEWDVVPGTPCPGDQPEEVRFTVVYRDFMPHDVSGGHPSFNWPGAGVTTGLVLDELDDAGKPVLDPNRPAWGNDSIGEPEDFAVWYRDSSYSKMLTEELVFALHPDGSYRLGSELFFPLDERGWVADGAEPQYEAYLPSGEAAGLHNFYFTTELKFEFVYQGGEAIEFLGDDDVWVFVNGQLALDVGGIHAAAPGSITLDQQSAEGFGLQVGEVYEVAVFHAERHVTMSTFALSLDGFDFDTP